MERVSVVITSHNTKNLTLECVKSIFDSKPEVPFEVIVVENGSNDGSRESLLRNKKIRLIVNDVNLGFGKGINQGARLAKGKYILVLNSDTRVTRGAIDKLYNFLRKNRDAGAVSAKLLNTDGTLQNSVYHFPSVLRAIREYWFGEKGVYEKYTPKENVAISVDAAVMTAFMISPIAINKVGLIDEKYFIYFEDLDYCKRLKKAGLKVYYLPDAVVRHHHGASGKNLARKEDQWKRLIPSSKIYNGKLKHYLLDLILRSGQKIGKFIPVFLALLLSIPTVVSMVRTGFFPMQDDLQAFRIYEMNKCLSDFQIPCRWVPDAGYQYGYPQFNFYPPLPYYFGSVLHLTGIQYIDVVKILFILGYALSAITIYILVTEVLKDQWAGFVSALLYTYIPYKAVEVYVRGALSEFWAQIFFPLILWAIYRLIKSGKIKYLIWMSVSIFFLMTTHVLMTIIFIPVAIIWAVFWLTRNKWKNIGKIVLGGILGLGLSSYFVLPVALERQFVHTEGILSGYFDYRQHFVSLYKLFISREWGYGSSGFPNEKLNLSLGIVQWVFGLIAVPIIAFVKFKRKKKLGFLTLLLTVTALGSIFMIHMKSSFIWAQLPFLQYMQFPWRFLAVAIFLLCLLCGIGILLIGRYKYIVGIFVVVTAFLLTSGYFVPKDWLNITDAQKFSGVSWEKQLTISIFDYLPIYAQLPPWQKAPELPEVLSGKVSFVGYQKGSDFQKSELIVTKDAILRLPLFDFPGMKVMIDSKVVDHVHNNCENERYCLGLITLNVPSGTHQLEVRLTDTPVRRIGNIVTLASIGFLMFLGFKKSRNDKILS